MLRLFFVAILISMDLMNTCEGSVLTIFTWRSYIQTPKELHETFKSKLIPSQKSELFKNYSDSFEMVIQ